MVNKAKSNKTWDPEKTSARMRFSFDDRSFYQDRIILQKLDSKSESGKGSERFSLYCFVKDLTYDNSRKDEHKPTILFIAGGPGQIVLPDTENFGDIYGYRTVYFHFRGSGFSQCPESSDYDEFLTTSHVVEDIEAIRKDLKVEEWRAVIGHSYGALVAHEYACKPKAPVEKVILSAPIWPESLKRSESSAAGAVVGEFAFHSDTLNRIYSRKDFGFLDHPGLVRAVGNRDVREYLLEIVKTATENIQKKGLSLTSVLNNFSELKKYLTEQEQKALGLDYGSVFLGALRRLGHVGWLALDVPYAKPLRTPKVDDTQVQCGLVIAKAVLSREYNVRLETILNDGILRDKLKDGEERLAGRSSLETNRAYYSISFNDELYSRFAGDAYKQLPKLDDIPDFNERRSPRGQPWNNVGKNKWKHNIPTLILKGSADPVTDKWEAEEYFNNQLVGQRVLIEFPGVGHAMALPDVRVSDPEFSKHHAMLMANVKVNGTAETRLLSTRDKLIDTFLADWGDIAEFENSEIVTSIKRAFDRCMRDQDEIEMFVSKAGPRAVSVKVEPKKTKPSFQRKFGEIRAQPSRTK